MNFDPTEFHQFCKSLRIDSKEMGLVNLGDNFLGTQHRLHREIMLGFQEGVREFVTLKVRQIGISTLSLAYDLYWINKYTGLSAAQEQRAVGLGHLSERSRYQHGQFNSQHTRHPPDNIQRYAPPTHLHIHIGRPVDPKAIGHALLRHTGRLAMHPHQRTRRFLKLIIVKLAHKFIIPETCFKHSEVDLRPKFIINETVSNIMNNRVSP